MIFWPTKLAAALSIVFSVVFTTGMVEEPMIGIGCPKFGEFCIVPTPDCRMGWGSIPD